MIDNIIINNILSQYPCKVNKIKLQRSRKDRAVWLVSTATDERILKKMPNEELKIKFIIESITHLQSKGINIPHIHPTINGDLYSKCDNDCYILMEAIQGKNLNYEKPKDIKNTIEALAKFHLASKGFKPT